MRNTVITARVVVAIVAAACGQEADGTRATATAMTTTTDTGNMPRPVTHQPRDAAIPAGLARVTFDVKGMTCGGCVLGTRKALTKLSGVRSADAAYDDKTGKGSAWAIYDPAEVTPTQMMAAIRQLGYVATPSGS